MVTVRGKLNVQQILTWENIPVPNTYFPADETNPDNWNFMHGDYPSIVKILHRNIGASVVLAESRAALKSIFDAFHIMKVPVIVQEFIKEAMCKDIRASVVSYEIIAAMERCARANDFRSNLLSGWSGYTCGVNHFIA